MKEIKDIINCKTNNTSKKTETRSIIHCRPDQFFNQNVALANFVSQNYFLT